VSRRPAVALAAAALVLFVTVVRAEPAPVERRGDRPNLVVILSDDQAPDTLPTDPPAMPWLQARIADPSDHWLWFPNAFINTPLCCPSRASILTGRYSHHTGVRTNEQGERLDEAETLPVWLQRAGYRTALFGKYLNRYPFDRGPYIPPGWDRWVAKRNTLVSTTYYGYGFVDQGVAMRVSDAPDTYATSFFADQAVAFIQDVPVDRPFFLYVAPSAPHSPFTPAPGDAGTFDDVRLAVPPSVTEADRSDKPRWVARKRPYTAPEIARLQDERRRQRETLLGMDDAVRRIVEALGARGELDRTVIVYLTDNGFAFGEHGIRGKRCPYEPCVHTPLAVRVPDQPAATIDGLVSNVDLAPTLLALAGARPGLRPDGASFARALEGAPWRGPPGVLLEYVGDAHLPRWWAVRTRDLVYIETADGTRELYDLTGRLGPADPDQLDNRADRPRYRAAGARLAALLDRLRSADGGPG
jgi:arylsulfatase A-like enzyme